MTYVLVEDGNGPLGSESMLPLHSNADIQGLPRMGLPRMGLPRWQQKNPPLELPVLLPLLY